MAPEEDPYTHEPYPAAFETSIGMQRHNARQVARHAVSSGGFRSMYREPLTRAQTDDILEKTGHVRGADGVYIRRKDRTRARRHAARELRRRQGRAVVGGTPQPPSVRKARTTKALERGDASDVVKRLHF